MCWFWIQPGRKNHFPDFLPPKAGTGNRKQGFPSDLHVSKCVYGLHNPTLAQVSLNLTIPNPRIFSVPRQQAAFESSMKGHDDCSIKICNSGLKIWTQFLCSHYFHYLFMYYFHHAEQMQIWLAAFYWYFTKFFFSGHGARRETK